MDSILHGSETRRNRRNKQAEQPEPASTRKTIVPGAQPVDLLSEPRLNPPAPHPATARAEDLTIPVVREEAEVHKVPVKRRVRIRKVVSEREQIVDPPLSATTFDIERVPIGRVIETPAEMRQEGDVTIYPVMEEVAVLTKQLILREEIRVRRRSYDVRRPQSITLRSEEVIVEPAVRNSTSPEIGNRSPE